MNSDGSVVTDLTHIGFINPFRYRSYYFDDETGLYYLKSRYYDPCVCRFISLDGLDCLNFKIVNGLNLWLYCFNNPCNYTDENGSFPVAACIFAIVAIIGLGLTIGGLVNDNHILTAVGLICVGIGSFGAGGLAVAGAVSTGFFAGGVIGGTTILAGTGTMLFASAEIQEASGFGNWIQNIGVNKNLYKILLLSVAGLATLGSIASFATLAVNPMTGFTNHGLVQALGRDGGHGVSRKAILDAVLRPVDKINQGSARGIKYVGKLATVILNESGKVITTYATTKSGWRFLILLCLLLGLTNINER